MARPSPPVMRSRSTFVALCLLFVCSGACGLTYQVLCLRLGAIHCHARAATGEADIVLRRDGDKARLGFAPGWSEDHPSTLHLLHEESDAWAKVGRLSLHLGPVG